MIKVIYAMLAIAIKDLEICLGNFNLPLGKSAIWFEFLTQKIKIGKQTAGVLYYKYQEFLIRAYTCFEKILAKTSFSYQNRIITIFKKWVVKQAIGRAKEKSEIVAIFNRYKNTLDDFIDSLNSESPDWQKLIDERSYNTLSSASNLMGLLERDFLDKNISNCWWTQRTPKMKNFQVHQYCNIAPFSLKIKKEHYKKDKRDRENRND